jgi:hypothetical protein
MLKKWVKYDSEAHSWVFVCPEEKVTLYDRRTELGTVNTKQCHYRILNILTLHTK